LTVDEPNVPGVSLRSVPPSGFDASSDPPPAAHAALDPAYVRRMLMIAAFGEPRKADLAWKSLLPLDIDTLPFEVHHLLPIVAERRREAGQAISESPRIDGIRKRLWSQNVVRARGISAAHKRLTMSGVPAVLTGGAAVLVQCRNWSLRPITEADLAIPHGSAVRAQLALADDGWRRDLRRHDGFLLDMRAVRFERGGQTVTLRWSSNGWPYDPDGPTLDVVGNQLPVASRASLLALTIVDAERLPGYPPARQLADVFLLCGATDDVRPNIDWTSFVRRVVQRHALPETAEFLGALTKLGSPIPDDVTEEIAALAASRRARRVPIKGSVAAAYMRRNRGGSVPSALRGMPAYLREVWDVDQGWKLPATFAARLVRHVRSPS
jgi:hypothetical protein